MTDRLPTLDQVRDDLFERALAKHGGKVEHAAAEIGVNFVTIYRWLTKKGLARGKSSWQKDGAASARPTHRPASEKKSLSAGKV